MKKTILLLVLCLSFSFVDNAQTRKPVRKTTTPEVKKPATPSANGKFKFDGTKGFINDTDEKDYIVISAPGKSTTDIKTSVISTLSDMYSNPNKVISTLGDNIINLNAYASDAFYIVGTEIIKIYSFNYNIKIEIKEGKIKVCSPSFSNITERRQSGSYVTGSSTISVGAMYLLLNETKQPVDFSKILIDKFNSHVSKIITGLSSNSDW